MDVKKLKIIVIGEEQGLDKIEQSTSRAGKAMGGLTSAASTALGTFTGSLMTKAADTLADFVQQGIKGFSDLQQATSNIKTIAPHVDTKQVFDALNQMQTRVPQTAAQLGDALYDVFSSVNVTQKEGLKLVEQFAKGATAAGTDAKTFGTATMGVLNAYSLKAKDAAHVSDLFFNTVAVGVISGQQLASSLGEVTKSAKLTGQDLNTLFASISAVTKAGGEASANVNNLNNLLGKLSSKEATKMFEGLGIKVYDAKGNFRDLVAILSELKPKLDAMTAKDRNATIMSGFADMQARSGLVTLLSQLDTLKQAQQDNATKAGATAAAYKTMSETFQSQSALIKNSFSAIATAVGSELLPQITPFMSTLAKDLPQAIGQVKPTLEALKTGFLDTFAPIMPMARDVAQAVQSAFESVKAWFTTNLPLIQQAVQTVLGTIGEFWKAHGDTIKRLVGDLFAVIGGIIRAAMQIITGDWRGLGETVKSIVTRLFDAVRASFEGFLGWTGDLRGRLFSAIGGMFTQLWQGFLTSTQNGVKALISFLWEQLLGGIENLFRAIGRTVAFWETGLNGGFRKVFDGWLVTVKAIPGKVLDYLKELPRRLPELYNELGKSAYHLGTSIYQGITGGIRGGQSLVQQAGNQMAQAALKGTAEGLESHSPSRKMHQLGRWAAQGFANGVKADIGLVMKSMVDMAGTAIKAFQKQQDAYFDSIRASKRQYFAAMFGEDSLQVFGLDNPTLSGDLKKQAFGQIQNYKAKTQTIETQNGFAEAVAAAINEQVRASALDADKAARSILSPDIAALVDAGPSMWQPMLEMFQQMSQMGSPGFNPSQYGIRNPQSESALAGLPERTPNLLPMMPQIMGKVTTNSQQMQAIWTPFMTSAEEIAKQGGTRFLENLLGGGNRQAALQGLLGDMQKSTLSLVAGTVTDNFKPLMQSVIKELGGDLGGVMRTVTQGVTMSLMGAISATYALIAASQRKSVGPLSFLGGVVGFAFGGPSGALAGFNIANAAENNDWQGVGLGLLSSGAGGAFKGGPGFDFKYDKPATTGTTRAAGPVTVNFTNNGGVNNAADIERLKQELADSVATGLRFQT